jgi:hypothetical protein
MDSVVDHGLRVRQAEFAKAYKLSLDEYLKIVRTCTATEVITLLELMKTSRHRSSFRASMHLKVRRWLDNDLSGHPLTADQFKALAPTWPVQLNLPR